MGAKPKLPAIQLTKAEATWLHGHLTDLLGGSGYFYRGATARLNGASVRDKLHDLLWPDSQGATQVQRSPENDQAPSKEADEASELTPLTATTCND